MPTVDSSSSSGTASASALAMASAAFSSDLSVLLVLLVTCPSADSKDVEGAGSMMPASGTWPVSLSNSPRFFSSSVVTLLGLAGFRLKAFQLSPELQVIFRASRLSLSRGSSQQTA